MTQETPYSVNPSNYVFQSFLRPWSPYVNFRPMMLETYRPLPYFNIFIQPFRAQPNNFYPSNYCLQSLPCAPIQQKQIPLISPKKIPFAAQNNPEIQNVIDISDDDDLPPPQKNKNSTQELSPQKCMSTAEPLRAKVEYKKANRLAQMYRNSRQRRRCPTEVKTRSIRKSQKKIKISRCQMMKSDKKMRRRTKVRDQKPKIRIGPSFQAVLPKCMLHSEGHYWIGSSQDVTIYSQDVFNDFTILQSLDYLLGVKSEKHYSCNLNFTLGIIMLSIIVCFLALVITFSEETTQIPTFEQFKARYNIQYSTETQDNFRRSLFQENITKLRNNPCETCGVTKFFVATYQEIKARKGLILHNFVSTSLESWREHLKNPASKFQFKYATTESEERQIQFFQKQKIFPEEQSGVKEKSKGDSKVETGGSNGKKIFVLKSMNWRDHNVVTAASDQGSCGSDSAFVAATLCESELILQGKAFNNDAFRVDLSEQYALKCTVGNDCSGGYLENAIDKTIVSGLPYEKDFQYNPSITQKGICHARTVLISNKRRRSSYFQHSDYRILKQLRNGPVGVALSADGWEMYAGGIYKCPPNPEINHAATIVGYNETAWIVKNSWGQDFGSDGYIYISRDHTDMHNCGIGIAIHWISEISLELYLGVTLLILLSY